MANRISREALESSMARIARALGKKTGDAWEKDEKGNNRAIVGTWTLDHNSVYGGYIIEETLNENGGVTHPLIERRMGASELNDALYMVERALYLVAKAEGK